MKSIWTPSNELSPSHVHQVTKRDEDSSLMQLKEEFRTYEALRREHDSQIVQIAMEGGLRIAPDQWSSLLYGDQSHKSHMQSIIDKVCLLGVLLKLNTSVYVKLYLKTRVCFFFFFFFLNSCRPQHLLPRVFRNSPSLYRELEIQLISTGCVPTLSYSQTLIPALVSNDLQP